MSITLRLVHLIDKLNVQKFFVEKNDQIYFNPLSFKFKKDKLEQLLTDTLPVNGKKYRVSELEKSIIKELDR